ncbi:MAG: N-acetylmuramoyl-L-alanine amidase [Evtepia sp.]
MPEIYLSPSTQEYNPHVTGGNEEEWMNYLVDAMIPYLESSGIRYTRNQPNFTAAQSIKDSNAAPRDLHLALHSNASKDPGKHRGILLFYFPGSVKGRRAADIMAKNLASVYPLPDLIRVEPNSSIAELRKVKAPVVYLELGYHDQVDDSKWIEANLDAIAQSLVKSIAEYFDLPFLLPHAILKGVVDAPNGFLNLYSRPSPAAPILAKAYNGAALTILNHFETWFLVQFGSVTGYARDDFIRILK